MNENDDKLFEESAVLSDTDTENPPLQDSEFKNPPHTEPTAEDFNYADSKEPESFRNEPVTFDIKPEVQNDYGNKRSVGFSWVTLIVSAVLSLLIGAGSAIAVFVNIYDKALIQPENSSGNNQVVNISVDESVNSQVEAVAKKVIPSVVGIRTTAAVTNYFGGSSNSTGEGSGVVYTADGYIITNYHIIETAVEASRSSIEVFFDGVETSVPATVVGYNISNDLAVLKVNKNGLVPITMSDISGLATGQYVAAIGAPGGLEYMGSVSYGVISGLNRTVSTGSDIGSAVQLIQTDAAINPGNSGGALVNMKGELVGINSEKIVSTSYEGMGFAIPINTVNEICNKIISKEYDPDPYIGITFSETWTSERLDAYGYPSGVVVSSVISGGPAAAAGVRAGDIITEYNGTELKSIDDINKLVSESKIGSTVTVKIYRSGRYYSTSITIGSNNSQ